MSKLHFSNNKFSKFIMGKGFYVVLALCLIGAGTAAWVAADRTLSSIENQNQQIIDQTPIEEELPWSIPDEPVRENIENIPKPSTSSSSSSSSASLSEASEPSKEPAKQGKQPAASSKQSTSVFVLPINGEVYNPFSEGKLVRNDTLKVWRTHDGIDIKAEKGTSVSAVQDGKVLTVKEDPLWGTVVEIEHSKSLVSVYCGLSKDVKIEPGDTVKTSQTIGTVDVIPAELNGPSHLHFGMRKDGKWVNPLKEMGKL